MPLTVVLNIILTFMVLLEEVALLLQVFQALHLLHYLTTELFFATKLSHESGRALQHLLLLSHIKSTLNVYTRGKSVQSQVRGRVISGHLGFLQCV